MLLDRKLRQKCNSEGWRPRIQEHTMSWQSSELSVHASYFNKLIIIHKRLVWEEYELGGELVQQEED